MFMQLELEPPYLIIKPCPREEDFYRLAGEDDDWEYLDGRIVMHSPASIRHEDLFRFLITLLSNYLDEKDGGSVFGSRYPMRLDPKWSPEPDILFVREEREHLLQPKCLEGPADLVVEIVSESESHLIYREKLPRYREAAIPEIWIVDPLRPEVHAEVLASTGEVRRSLTSGRLESSTLPGFWIEVDWLWREKLPSTVQCFREILGKS